MLELNEWCAGDKRRVYVASLCPDPVYIEQLVRTGEARLRCKNPAEVARLTNLMASAGFDFSRPFGSWNELIDVLFALPGNHTRHGLKKAATPSAKAFNSGVLDRRTPQEISADSLNYSLSSAPFKSKTISNCKIVVDSREPNSLVTKMSEGKIAVCREALEVGDIKLISADTDDHIIIERKTVTDFYSSITEPEKRAHSQAERLFDYQNEFAKNGTRVQVIWMIEGEQNGVRTLYNALPQTNQMDGMINYLVSVLNQHVVQAYNCHHLCYLVQKFVQGFFEQELFYPVKSISGAQIDRRKSERSSIAAIPLEQGRHGVSIPGRQDLFHVLTSFKSVDSRIANSLIETGLVLKDILALSKEDLVKFNGIGRNLAEKIEREFNM